MEKKYLKLISYLSENRNHYFPAEQLSQFLTVSVRTINRYINDINTNYIDDGFIIESSYGKGFKINVLNEEIFSSFYAEINEFEEFQRYILIKGLLDETIHYSELEKTFYLSKASLLREIDNLNKQVFQLYKVQVSVQNNKVLFQGSELMIRNLIIDAIPNISELSLYFRKFEITVIKYLSRKLEYYYKNKSNRIAILDFYTQSKYLFVSLYRDTSTLESLDSEILNMISLKKEHEYNDLIEEIIYSLSRNFSLSVSASERRYWLLILLSEEITSKDFNNDVIKKVNYFVNSALASINIKYGFDMSRDTVLIDNLIYHLVNSLSGYILYQKTSEQDLVVLSEVRKQYRLAYFFSIEFCDLFSEKFDIPISDKEKDYITIHFATALEKATEEEVYPLAFVSNKSNATRELLRLQLNRTLTKGKILDTFKEWSNIEVDKYEYIIFEGAEADLETKFKNIIYMENLTADKIDYAINEKNSFKILKRYYNDNLFLKNVTASDRFEAISEMCEFLVGERMINSSECNNFIEREISSSTVISDSVAMPHALISSESFISIGIFKNPIVWRNNIVSVFFLVGLQNENKFNKELVQSLIFLCRDESFSRKILKVENKEDVMKIIRQER